MSKEKQGRSIDTTATSIQLTDAQQKEFASALGIDVKYVPSELGVLGVSRNTRPTGIPVDRAGQFAPALILM